MHSRLVTDGILIALTACSGGDTTSSSSSGGRTMTIAAGDNQTSLEHLPLPIAPTVRITDANGQPVPGVTVTFISQPYGGTITDSVVQTGADGTAAVGSWTVFAEAGISLLKASAPNVAGSPVTFSATVLSPLFLNYADGTDGQQAPAGTAVAVPPQVTVFALSGAVSGLRVVFSVIGGGGSITGDTAIVNPVGVATVGSWTLGPVPGVNQLRAVVLQPLGSDSITFTAAGT